MKQVFTSIVALVAVCSFATVAWAATLNDDSRDRYVFRVTNISGTNGSANNWSRSTTIGDNDLISFAIYYHVTSGTANNVTFKMDDIRGSYAEGQTITVSGQVRTSNAGTSAGTSRVTFRDDVDLRLYNVSWQPNQCTSVVCERSFSGSPSRVLGSQGINVGSVAAGWPTQGSMVVTFKAVEVSQPQPPTPTYDDCRLDGVTVRHGESRRFYSERTTSGQCSAYDLVRRCNDGVLSGSSNYRYASCTYRDDEPSKDADVTTNRATSVDEDSARLNGNIRLYDWNDADVYFQWGTSSSNLNNSTRDQARSSDGTFSQVITGLRDNEEYYFRAVAEERGERSYGAVLSFRTLAESQPTPTYDDCRLDGVTVRHGESRRFYSERTTSGQCSAYDLVRRCNDGVLSGSSNYRYASCTYRDDEPSKDADVTTNRATSVDEDSARLNGEWEGDNNIDVWFAFSRTDSTPSCNATSQRVGETDADDGDDFSETVTGLRDNEKYYFRACAEDADGDTVSGAIRNFTTDEEDEDDDNDDDVEVRTSSASRVDEDSARLNGEMRGDNNIDVWFAFSRTDSTPSCNATSQRVGETDADDGDDFSETVTGLRDNEKYYFRACAEDNDGSIVSGAIRNFVTDEDDDNDNRNTDEDDELRVVTNVASNITTSSARLNSIVIGQGEAECYFQYGRTTTLGLVSPRVSVDLDEQSSCNALRTGLVEDATYYFRAVLVQNREIEYGSTRSFRTNRPATPVSTTPSPRVTIVRPEPSPRGDLDVTKLVSAENDPRFDTFTAAAPGETVYYKVRVENQTGQDLEDITVIDQIPFYLELDEDRGTDDDDDKQVRWVIDLNRGESRTFVTEMRVREDADRGDLIISYASAEHRDFTANSNDVEIEVTRLTVIDEDEGVEPGQRAFTFGAGIFPTDLTGWAFLILILLAIAYLISRLLEARNERARILAEISQMQGKENQGSSPSTH